MDEQSAEVQIANHYIARTLFKHRKNKTQEITHDIPSLRELAGEVVAKNFTLYPDMEGVEDQQVKSDVVKLVSLELPIIVTAPNIEFEFYWEKLSKAKLKNTKIEDHGLSWKQTYLERYIQQLLEKHKAEGSLEDLRKELWACRHDIFCLRISQLLSHLDMGICFKTLQNLAHLSLTYGAKHVGMEYERSLFGMKMSDAKIFSECLRTTHSLTTLSLPSNLIDDDLISILIKGLMLNKTLIQLDLSHNRIGNSGARKIAKYLLQNEVLTRLDLGDNIIHYEGSRYLAQALKVNKTLKGLILKLNRIDDKGGAKLCNDLMTNNTTLEELSLAGNSLGEKFCESLAELLMQNKALKKLDLSCNFITDSSATTLQNSLEFTDEEGKGTSVVELDIRNNQLSEGVEDEIHEIVTKNYLKSKSIPFVKRAVNLETQQNDEPGTGGESQ